MNRIRLILFTIFLITLLLAAITSDSRVSATYIDEDESDSEETLAKQKDVRKRNLVRENVRYKSIVSDHDSYYYKTDKRTFPSDRMTLGYVTPWNSKGYEMAELFRDKFTHISPVWHQIVFNKDVVDIKGQHDVDREWMKTVRSGKLKTKIVPRIIFEGWNSRSLNIIFKTDVIIPLIQQVVKEFQYDGIVLEGVIPYFEIDKEIRNEFVQKLYKSLKSIKKELIIVSPPLRTTLISADDLVELSKYCDAISMMTYDYDPNRGLLAPLYMSKDIIDTLKEKDFEMKKLLLGLPFYGYTGASGKSDPILGHQYVELLEKYKPKKIQWDTNSHEHVFTYKDDGNQQRWANFPSLLFLEQRISLAKESGCSLSIWELGQGFNYFYDLL